MQPRRFSSLLDPALEFCLHLPATTSSTTTSTGSVTCRIPFTGIYTFLMISTVHANIDLPIRDRSINSDRIILVIIYYCYSNYNVSN